MLGRPLAACVASGANRSHRIAVIFACHRRMALMGADGTFAGSGGGLARKRRWLMADQHAMRADTELWNGGAS